MSESDYGDYMCRIEINNEKHRLDMFGRFSAEPLIVSTLNIYIKLILIITPIFILMCFIVGFIIYVKRLRFKFTKNKAIIENGRIAIPTCIEDRKYRQFFKQFCRQLSKPQK